MKKSFCMLFFLMILGANAQVCIGSPDYFGQSSKPTKPDQIAKFKSMKTIFVLSDIFSKDQYNAILSKYWKVTEFEIITLKEFDANPNKYKQMTHSIAELKSYVLTTTYTSSSGTKVTNHIFVSLDWYIIDEIKEKKGKTQYKTTTFASVFFTPDVDTRIQTEELSLDKVSVNRLQNYKLGYFTNYIQFINDGLTLNSNFNCFDESINKEKMKSLKTGTLILSEEIKKKFKAYQFSSGKDREITELLEDYKYKYEVLSEKEIDDKIKNNEDFYYLIYSQINAKKIISIVNSKTGEIIYNVKDRLSYNIKPNDFKDLNKVLSKL